MESVEESGIRKVVDPGGIQWSPLPKAILAAALVGWASTATTQST